MNSEDVASIFVKCAVGSCRHAVFKITVDLYMLCTKCQTLKQMDVMSYMYLRLKHKIRFISSLFDFVLVNLPVAGVVIEHVVNIGLQRVSFPKSLKILKPLVLTSLPICSVM